tara:strand:- start:361 stop:585 length:225 start_codon:yes stop_codon:yes gene_type:complete
MVCAKKTKNEKQIPRTISGKRVTLIYNGKESNVTNNLLKKILINIQKKINQKKKEKTSHKESTKLCRKTISLKI